MLASRATLELSAPSHGLVDTDEIEGISDAAYVRARLPWPASPKHLAVALGYTIERAAVIGCGVLVRTRIIYRPRRDAREELAAVAHELAHGLLARTHHDHRDVWRLTLALFLPCRAAWTLRAVHGLSLERAAADQPYAPEWALKLRLAMLREIEAG